MEKYNKKFKLGKNGFDFVQNKLPKKLDDIGIFVLPCRIQNSKAYDTLADLGSCINIIPLSLYRILNFGKLEATKSIIGLVDGSVAYPVGILKDMVVHIDRLTILADFHVLDILSYCKCPLLVGIGFLATASVIIDCKMSKIAVGEEYTRSIYDVHMHEYDNEGDVMPNWLVRDRKPPRYGPRIGEDFTGHQRPFFLEDDFVKNASYIEQQFARETEIDPFEDPLVFRKMIEFLGVLPTNLKMNNWGKEDPKSKWSWDKPPKDGDGLWHIRMTLIDPNGEKFEKSHKTKPTKRILKEKFDPKDVLSEELAIT